MQHRLLLSQVYAFLTIVLWSSAYVLTKIALQYYSFSSLALARCFIASMCLGGILAIKRTPFPGFGSLPRFLLSGAAGFAVYILVFNTGAASLNPTTSCILISTSPIITAFLAQWCFGERLAFPKWVAIGLAFGGILIMTLWDGVLHISSGILWMLTAAVLVSIYTILQRQLSKTFEPLTITAYSFFWGTFLLLPFAAEAVGEIGGASSPQLGVLLFLGVFPSALAYLFWTKAISLSPSTSNVSNYMFLTPFLALLLEYLFTGEVPGMATFVGGGVILLSLAVFILADRKKGAPVPQTRE